MLDNTPQIKELIPKQTQTTTYERWLDFTTRLAGILDVTDARREKIVREVAGFIERFEDEQIHGWDTFANYTFYGDGYDISGIADDTTYFGEYRLDRSDGENNCKFYNQISAITKAGLDVAIGEFGGGVIGFTVGDVQKMYDGNIPEWVLTAIDIKGDEDENTYLWL